MANSFDLSYQNQHIESKITVALERISEAFRVLLWQQAQELKLSPIQIQILIFCCFHSSEKCKVGYLAQEFNLDKSTISDSVKVLEQKKLIEKFTTPEDGRSYIIGLTDAGLQIAQQTASFALPLEKPIQELSDTQKEVLLFSLLELIHKLQRVGIISLQRMCFSCQYFQKTNRGYYCKFLNIDLSPHDLRVDCPEHELSNLG
ncbi:MarR family winged helix-turn-helix transcriptional regulator [Haliscomenobacter hydrossis]|uniref:Regulatory protein MarR n=1 Tax=Haliscomenobacter hydrossis (strain ATCC 27775 / DSM 1100 / LMG 10767 / O) TaxID=760192 RepID=F4L204_HALH1|nr:MarR family winged helix-turn-helix transcriptional regulator [Haliscomenobacter hydrossis]AEE50637.1 regulatory protein MarR [Haliscomenobacter hydrossis DSM 1100]